MTLLANNDIPANVGPGNYIMINSRGQNPGAADRAFTGRFRVNIIAPVSNEGTLYLKPDVPVLMGGMDDVVSKCGRRSPARAMVEYALSAHPAGVDVYVTPIVMSGGSAAAFSVYVPSVDGATAATGSGQAQLRFNDYMVPVDINDGDTPAVVAAKLKAAFDLYIAPLLGDGKGVSYTAGSVVGNAVPFTQAVAGQWGNDHPVAVFFPDTVSGIAFGPGFIVFAGGPTGAANGQVTVRCHAKSAVLTAVPMGTTANNLAIMVANAINAQTDFPLRAAVRTGAPDTVDLFYKNGRPAHDIQVSVTAAIGPVTATYTGETLGTGVPLLSNALTALSSSDAMQEWATCFTDATSLGLIVQHLRTNGDGFNQKEQFLWWSSTLGLSAAGAVVTSIAPSVIFEDAAKASPGRNVELVCPNAFQPAYCLASMLASDRAAQLRPTKNFDGRPIISNLPGIPLTYPDAADRLDEPSANQARSVYYCTPLYVKDGNFCVQQLVTTYGGTLPLWSSGSYVRGMANIRQEMRAALSVFDGKEKVRFSPALTEDVFTNEAVPPKLYARAKLLEKTNLYDGADKFRALFAAEDDPDHPDWTRVYIPGSPPIENHVIAGQVGPVSV